MAHIFDYSQSGAAQWQLLGSNLFGSVGGDLLTDVFWDGMKSQTIDIVLSDGSTLDGGAISQDTTPITGSFDPSIYSSSTYLTGGPIPPEEQTFVFTIDNPNIAPMPERLLQGPQDLAFFTPTFLEPDGGGDFLRINGIDAPTVQFNKPTFDSAAEYTYSAVQDLFDASATAAIEDLYAQVTAILARPLTDLDSVEVVQVSNGESSGTLNTPESVLIYTPDPDTNLTIGTLFQTEGLDPSFPDSALFGSIQPQAELLAGEDLEFRLTNGDDSLDVSEIGAASVTVYAGAGDDLYFYANTQENPPPLPDRVTYFGEAGDDFVEITSRLVYVEGGEGDDTLVYFAADGGSTDSVILGGAGNDDISGEFVDGMTLRGGEGSDFLTGDATSQLTLYGDEGDDDLRAGSAFSFVTKQFTYTTIGQRFEGGAGNDSVIGGDGADFFLGGSGNDHVNAQAGEDTLKGGDGYDTYEFQIGSFNGINSELGIGSNTVEDDGGLIDIIVGGELEGITYRRIDDDLMVTLETLGDIRAKDFFANYKMWEVRLGELSTDGIRPTVDLGSLFFESVVFTDGDDIQTINVRGSYDALSGDDTVIGSAEGDDINGGDGLDNLIGNAGDDTLVGGTSQDDLRDLIYGGDGDDSIEGGYGNDELRGDAGNDRILGGFGADRMIGGAGNDDMSGGALGDVLFGSGGADFLNGGFGFDRLNGGADADQFYHLGIENHGSDWVQDYNSADGDILVFGDTAASRAQFQVNTATTPLAGADGIEEAFVIYRPTGQIIWALVDGAGQEEINLRIGSFIYDLADMM